MRTLTVIFFLISFVGLSQKDTLIFSHPSGIYSETFQLTLSNSSGNTIFYSLDGDYPKTKYTSSISISKSITVRVKNERELKGYTQNYIYQKHTLPVVCLTIKPADLYDTLSGIYVKGPNAKKEPPYLGANFHKGWEKQAYIEMIDTNNVSLFNQKVGVKIFGQFSAMLPQKSFAIYARKKYGNKRVKTQLFLDLPYKKYKSFILRNSGSDFCNSHFRDAMMTSLVKDFNFEVQSYRSCVVYLNGNYWGIYHIREKINEHFLKQHTGIDKDSVAILKYRGARQHNGKMNYNSMLRFITKSDFSVKENIDSLNKLMDIDNYLDYNIAQVYFNNIDAGGNIRFWRPTEKGGKWRWILFDTDFGYGLRKGNRQEQNTVENYFVKSNRSWPYPNWSTLIIRKLVENDSIKEVYLKKFSHYLNTTFSENNVLNHIHTFESSLKPEINQHFKKWKRSANIWNTHLDLLKTFAKERPIYLRKYLRKQFQVDTVYKITTDSIHNGMFFINGNKIEDSSTRICFSTITYSLEAKPAIGYIFSHWTDDTTQTNPKRKIVFNKDISIAPIFIKKKKSDWKGKVWLNEISRKNKKSGDYIEIFNSSENKIDLSHWKIKNEKGECYTIKEGTSIGKMDYLVLYKKELKEMFNITKETHLTLFDNLEKEVDVFKNKNEKFKESKTLERVNSLLKKGWEKTQQTSPGYKNDRQTYYEQLNKKILIGFGVMIGLLILSGIYFKVRKRPSGATE